MSATTFLYPPTCRLLLELRDDDTVDHTGISRTQLRHDLRTFVFKTGQVMRNAYRTLVRAVENRGIGYLDADGYLVITDWHPIEEAVSTTTATSGGTR